MTKLSLRRVAPFGYLRINAYVRLPEAFRSLSRPSSPVRAKASTVRPYSLDRKYLSGLTSNLTHTAVLGNQFRQPRGTGLQSSHPLSLNPNCQIKEEKNGIGCAQTVGSELFRRGAVKRLTYSILGKEVIQPQVPLRLPCYDFAPVIKLAFGRWLLSASARVAARTSGAPNFHGVTGGVYKARERIHRVVADTRLLAIPASCSRVTDCNPNLDRLWGIRSGSRLSSPLYRPL